MRSSLRLPTILALVLISTLACGKKDQQDNAPAPAPNPPANNQETPKDDSTTGGNTGNSGAKRPEATYAGKCGYNFEEETDAAKLQQFKNELSGSWGSSTYGYIKETIEGVEYSTQSGLRFDFAANKKIDLKFIYDKNLTRIVDIKEKPTEYAKIWISKSHKISDADGSARVVVMEVTSGYVKCWAQAFDVRMISGKKKLYATSVKGTSHYGDGAESIGLEAFFKDTRFGAAYETK